MKTLLNPKVNQRGNGKSEQPERTIAHSGEDSGSRGISGAAHDIREIISKCVCDTGSDINVMPLEIANKLWESKFEPTNTTLLLPNGAVIEPVGALSRVPIQIRTFIMPTTFVVVDAHRRPSTPLILGRPFLATVEALIDAQGGYINFWRLGCRFKQAEPVDNELTLLGFVDSNSDSYSDDDA